MININVNCPGSPASYRLVLPGLGVGPQASLALEQEWVILDSGYSKKKKVLCHVEMNGLVQTKKTVETFGE